MMGVMVGRTRSVRMPAVAMVASMAFAAGRGIARVRRATVRVHGLAVARGCVPGHRARGQRRESEGYRDAGNGKEACERQGCGGPTNASGPLHDGHVGATHTRLKQA